MERSGNTMYIWTIVYLVCVYISMHKERCSVKQLEAGQMISILTGNTLSVTRKATA